MTIKFEDFLAVDIRVGTVLTAEYLENAKKPAIKLMIDFGSVIGKKKTSAQITGNYTPEILIGRQVLAVVNLQPKQIGTFMSEVLVLGLPDTDNQITLIQPDKNVVNGSRLH